MFREDYIMRMIQQLADAVARIAGFRKRREFEQALVAASQSWDELLGVSHDIVAVTDGPTLAQLLREPIKMRGAAQLLAEEARAFAGKGDPIHAALRYKRALELYLEARALEPDPEDDAHVLELSRFVPPGEIDPRYRA